MDSMTLLMFATLSGQPLPAAQYDSTTYTITATSFSQASKSYPLYSVAATTLYRLTAWGDATTSASPAILRWQLAAFGVTLAEIQIGSVWFLASTSYEWRITWDLQVIATGTSGTVKAWGGGSISTFGTTLNNSSAGSSMGITGASGGTTANTTTNTALELQTEWSGSGQTMHCYGSTLETIAPLF